MKLARQLKEKADKLKLEILTIYYAYRHPDIKILPKIIILISLGYFLSPIDLIPDFIPVIGYLDDLIIIPALISLSVKLIPQQILIESRFKAEKYPVKLPENRFSAILIIIFWLLIFAFTAVYIYKLIKINHPAL